VVDVQAIKITTTPAPVLQERKNVRRYLLWSLAAPTAFLILQYFYGQCGAQIERSSFIGKPF